MFSKITNFSGVIAAAILVAVCIAIPARAQTANADAVFTLPATKTSSDGKLTLTLSSSNPSDAVGVPNTYTWTATNISSTPLTGVVLGSHWGDYCVGNFGSSATGCFVATTGPTLISLAPGCGGQSPDEFPANIAALGVWCTPITGVTLAPGASISGSVTLRPGTGGPAYYGVYTGQALPGQQFRPDPFMNYHGMVAPAATDVQITGAASTGSPLVGSTFTYTYQIHDAGTWGTFGGIIFQDVLPASLNFVSVTVEQAGTDPTTGQEQLLVTHSTFNPLDAPCSLAVNLDQTKSLVCTLNDLTLGGVANTAKVIVTVEPLGPAGSISNTATVHFNPLVPQPDSNPNNNSVTLNVTTK